MVEIYRTCTLDRAGLAGAAVGLSALEIQAALKLHGVPRRRWPDYTRDLQVMAQAACAWLHEQDKRRAETEAAKRRAGKQR